MSLCSQACVWELEYFNLEVAAFWELKNAINFMTFKLTKLF